MQIVSEKKELLGTVIEIKLLTSQKNLFKKCFEEIKRIEKTYSRFLDDSALSKLNSNLGKWVEIDDELLFLLSKAKEFLQKTSGSFDITLKSVLDSIGYDKNYSLKPKPISLQKNSAKGFELDLREKKVLLQKEIDFGGFGKGFALDKVSALLEKNSAEHYYINAGGDIFAKKGKNLPEWEIILEHPDDGSMAIGKILLDGKAIAASSPSKRKWGEFHHLIDPKTGKPALGIKSVFVLAKTGLEADAFATGLFCAGFSNAILLSQQLPIEVLIVSGENKMYQSKGFNAELFR